MKNYTYSGWKLNGFFALLVQLAIAAGAGYLIYFASTLEQGFALPVIGAIILVLAGVIRIDYDMISPGGLNEVGNVISVDAGYNQTGSFNTVSVYSVERIPLLTYLIGKLDNIVSIDETSELVQMTDQESVSSGTIQKNVSINNAIILAYKTANKQISTNYHGLIVHTVYNDVTYDVKIGDVITKYNGENITNEKEFRTNLVNDVRNGNDIKLTIYRDGTYHDVNYEPVWTKDKKSFYVGISYYDYYTINEEETNPKFTLNKANTLGPSGGLMQALSVYNAITEFDITLGLKIAGTGTIDIHGDVGPIGGIYQKVFTAYFSNADVFFVPVELDEFGEIIKTEGSNYMEALKAYEVLGKPSSLAFVPVATFSDAVKYLESLK